MDRNAVTFLVPKNRAADVAAAQVVAAESYQLLIDKKVSDLPLANQGPGKGQSLQYFVFADKRTDVTEAAPLLIASSGFSIDFELTKDYLVGVAKQGQDNNGVKAGIISAADGKQRTVSLK